MPVFKLDPEEQQKNITIEKIITKEEYDRAVKIVNDAILNGDIKIDYGPAVISIETKLSNN